MIRIENLSRVFSKKFGIKAVTFDILPGSIVAFVGDNGAGKTTTIKAIFGEIHLKEGRIEVDGEDIFSKGNLKKVAFFPDSNNIPLNMTVHEYVKYLSAVNNMSKSDTEANSEVIYKMLNLENHQNKKLKELSAGLKKRAIMASVLVRSPKYIILDEPTANLDVESKLEFIVILKELNKLGVTILITSHIIEELQEIANYLVLIKNGEIVYRNYFNNEKEQIMDIYKKFIDPKIINVNIIESLYRKRGN